jgi:hypothetical protein
MIYTPGTILILSGGILFAPPIVLGILISGPVAFKAAKTVARQAHRVRFPDVDDSFDVTIACDWMETSQPVLA